MFVKFSEVEIGDKFFDPYSGEFYIKVGDNSAVDVTDCEDQFDLTDMVEV